MDRVQNFMTSNPSGGWRRSRGERWRLTGRPMAGNVEKVNVSHCHGFVASLPMTKENRTGASLNGDEIVLSKEPSIPWSRVKGERNQCIYDF